MYPSFRQMLRFILNTNDLYCIVWTFAYIRVRISVKRDAFAISLKYEVGKKGVANNEHLKFMREESFMICSSLVRIRAIDIYARGYAAEGRMCPGMRKAFRRINVYETGWIRNTMDTKLYLHIFRPRIDEFQTFWCWVLPTVCKINQ